MGLCLSGGCSQLGWARAAAWLADVRLSGYRSAANDGRCESHRRGRLSDGQHVAGEGGWADAGLCEAAGK